VKSLSIIVLATLALGLTAGQASAADIQSCRSDSTISTAPGFKRVGREVRKAIGPEVRKHLGAQYTALWMQPDDAGWYVGVAPGRRSLAATRAWLRERIARHFSGSEAALIRSRMHVVKQPYGLKELREVGNKVWDILRVESHPANWSGDEACTLSDAYRSEVTLYKDSNETTLRDVKDLLAEFGDRVRVTRVDYAMSDDVGR
jgi:hypothetical protein